MRTPGPWEKGKAVDAVIASTRPEGATLAYEKSCVEYYGGYVIAESILPCNRPIIRAAPDLLAACEAALDKLVNEVAECSCQKVWEDDDYVCRCPQCELRTAIAKAKEKS